MTRTRRSEAGGATVELAVVLPLLVAVLVGTADFARVFYTALALTNAARAGAQYGASSVARSNDTTGMQNTAVGAAPNISGVTADASSNPKCKCADDDGSNLATAAVVSCTSACGSTQHMIAYVTVTASKTFTTISPFPGIPRTLPITRTASMRVPN